MDALKKFANDTSKAVTGKEIQEHLDTAKEVVGAPPALVNDKAAPAAFGTAPEPAGKTSTGGRRLRSRRRGKTAKKGGKRHRGKTHRRR